jgi:hypothetical protein
MGAKVSTTNVYMRDPARRERSIFKSVASSSAIEGIRAPFLRPSSGATKSGKARKLGITRLKP